MDIPVTVTTHSIEVDVTNEVVSVVVAVQTKTIQVTINYGLNATQVDAAIDAKLSKENVVGLKLTDSPEFADTEITGLATESTYTPAVWSYLVGLFTTVPKSVLQHIVNIWAKIYDFEKYSYLKTFEISIDQLVSGEYFNAARVAASAIYTTSLPINRLIMHPITVSSDVSINSAMLRVYSGALSSKIIIGIYEGNPFYPYSRIWSSNEIETETAGIKNEDFSLTLRKNKVYWFAYIVNSVDPRIYLYQPYQNASIKGTSLPAAYNAIYVNLNYGAMPATLEGTTLIDIYTILPIISLRKA